MRLTTFISTISVLLIATVHAFSSTASNNMAIYWGQNSANAGQQSLQTYCDSDSVDIVVLAFLMSFPEWSLNLAGDCTATAGQKCPDAIGQGIKYCQQKGKIVMLSLGGEAGTYGFTSDDQAVSFAATLWNTFGGGSDSSVVRPFGDAVIDGFDLDIENKNPTGYAALVSALRTKYATDSSRQYYVSAAPQCVYPDASVGAAMAGAVLDFAFIQFYNNYCNLNGGQFNWATWADYASLASPNRNIRLYVGLPGGAQSAGSGYASVEDIKANLPSSVLQSPNFGGISLWDMASSFANNDNGVKFVDAVKQFLSGGSTPLVNTVIATTADTAQATKYDAVQATTYDAVQATTYDAVQATTYAAVQATTSDTVEEPELTTTIIVTSTVQAQALASKLVSDRIGNKMVVAGRLIDPTTSVEVNTPTTAQITTTPLEVQTLYEYETVTITVAQ